MTVATVAGDDTAHEPHDVRGAQRDTRPLIGLHSPENFDPIGAHIEIVLHEQEGAGRDANDGRHHEPAGLDPDKLEGSLTGERCGKRAR